MPYAGGKQRLADRIVSLMPSHHHYVEPFAGALSVLLAKPIAPLETINDLDGDIVTFWRVLRDRPGDLERMCALTPHARDVYQDSRHPVTTDNDLTQAWRVWVRLTQGRGSRTDGSSGWRFVNGSTTRMTMAKYLTGYLARIGPAAERLRLVSIDHRPALDVIHGFDMPGTLFYVDPPYLASTRTEPRTYRYDMGTMDDHQELLHTLRECHGQVILSGYRSDLYDQVLHDWTRIDLAAPSTSGRVRTDSLWLNYTPPTLLNDKDTP